jgi:hypothetical protein
MRISRMVIVSTKYYIIFPADERGFEKLFPLFRQIPSLKN